MTREHRGEPVAASGAVTQDPADARDTMKIRDTAGVRAGRS
jgi:hypothetical protein